MTTARVLTFDLWDTLLDGEPRAEARQRARAETTQRIVAAHGLVATVEQVREAFDASTAAMVAARDADPRDRGPRTQIADMLRRLDPAREPAEPLIAAVHDGFTQVLHALPPEPFAGAAETLAALALHAPVGLVCNTGWSGGAALRPILAAHGLTASLTALAFSDEVGWGKPDDRIFTACLRGLGTPRPERVLHVGDSLRADIAGAKRLGACACWIAPPGDDTERALRVVDPLLRPDLVFPSVAAAGETLGLWLRGELFPG